jgi:serine/threonine protein kinase
MADKVLAIVDPSGRLIAELAPLAAAAQVSLLAVNPGEPAVAFAAILIAASCAGDLGPAPATGPPRWIAGDAANAARLAGAALEAGAAGALLLPGSAEAIAAIVHAVPALADRDLARARGLIATSLVELTHSAAISLLAVADEFAASDCVLWWKDGSSLGPVAARPSPTESYRAQIASAARIAAVAAGTVITSGKAPRSVIGEALRVSATEVAGLIAIVADTARRFSEAERADLRALALRLARELAALPGPGRPVADGERSLAANLRTPVAGAAPHRPPAGAGGPADDARAAQAGPGVESGGLAIGTIVGGTYRVVRELSRGAMGVVYRGEDLGLGRPVAIKVLRSDLASDRDLVARFRAEAGLLASLHHRNLVQVYALGEHDGDVYFVMELVEGQPLSEVVRTTIERNEWFPTAAAAQIALEIGDALDAMHEVGVIHRDVKPANILLDRERDRAVLVDVGVAVRAGGQRDAAGTPGFAAPESFLDHADAPTTDVYGLAATVYCMLTGRPPFGSGTAPQVMQRQLGEPLPSPSELRPSLSEAVDAVLAKALSPVAKKRWASASTFSIALARALDRLPGKEVVARSIEDPINAAESLLGPTEALDSVVLRHAARARAVTGQVRAAHLRVLSRLLQHHVGEAGLARIVSETPELAGALSTTLAPLGWVALTDLVTAFELARTYVPSQLVPRKVGRGTVSATFARLFGADPATLSAETLLTALPAFWAHYHDWGDLDVSVEPGRADLVLYGNAGSIDVCALVGAELERIVELTGAGTVGVTQTACAFLGAPRCEYRATWMH